MWSSQEVSCYASASDLRHRTLPLPDEGGLRSQTDGWGLDQPLSQCCSLRKPMPIDEYIQVCRRFQST